MSGVADSSLSLFWMALAVMGLFLVAGLVVMTRLSVSNRSLKDRLLKQEQACQDAQSRYEAQSALLLETEREVARLKQGPKAELLPIMQLAHELRSPLAAVQHSLEVVLQGYTKNNPELHDEMLVLAQERTRVMLEHANDFLRLGAVKYAEIERKPQLVQLMDAVRRLAPEMRVRARWVAVDLHLNLPESLPLVAATNEDAEHLLANLISNAIKYTEPGGRVTFTLAEKDGNVVGTVEDTGIGIAPEEIPRIFGEFYRAESAKGKAQGTGLGLSIVKQVLDLYGGQIHVELEPGKGSKFVFSFPGVPAER